MEKLKLLVMFLIFCSVCEKLVAMLCWKNPTCFCTGRKTKSIYCRGVRNVSDIEGLFRRWTWTYRLRIYGNFTTLPSKAFDGFTVKFVDIGAPLGENIPEDALLGVIDLLSVNLTRTRFQKIPQAVLLKHLKLFRSIRGSLSAVDTDLQNMTLLEHIVLQRNEISFISEDAFLGTNNVQTLDLSYNKLAFVQPDTFIPLKFLYHINLKFNQLQTVDDLFRTLNPRIINLYGNNISSVEHAFHRGMWSTRLLNLGGNPTLNLSASAFNGSMKSLADLYLSDVDLETVDPHLLMYFPNLIKLYLNRDNITYIPKTFFEYSRSLNTLELRDNRLKSIDGLFGVNAIGSWKIVFLDGNELTSVSFGDHFQGVHTLDISRNQIKSIKKADFEALKGMKSLNISWNGVYELESECFSDMHSLRFLDLTGSNVKRLNGSVNNLPRLDTLYMKHSTLESLTEEEFSGSERVKLLHLHNNSLTSVFGAFRSLKYIRTLDISMNNLTTLTTDSFPPNLKNTIRVTRLTMADNPWSCDCRLSWIPGWLAKGGTVLVDNPICSTPTHLQAMNISSLNKADFEQWVDDCPDECECLCQAQGEDIRTEVNCSRRGLEVFPDVLPSNAWAVNMQNNVLDSFDGREVLHLENLDYLNLEDNKIAKIVLELPNGTTSILLAGNKIRVLAQNERDILGSLSNITLSRNPWTCNCDTWSFRTWLLQHNESVFDQHEVRCGPDEGFFLRNKPVIDLTYQDLCAVLHVSTMVIIALCAALFMVLCILCCAWRQSLSAWLYSCGCGCLKSDEKYEEPYDVFLMYSEDDEDLALAELAKGLEEERFLVCIPSRDIPAPRTPEKVSAYLMQCSKVVVLLTRKFLENYDCMHLLKNALSCSLDSSARNLMFVSDGAVPPRSRMDPLLAATMKSCICLRWGERLFWQKLVYYLPKTTSKTVVTTIKSTDEDEPLLR